MEKTFKKASRIDYYNKDGLQPNNEQLTLGRMQRIADATELMAILLLIAKLVWMEMFLKRIF